MPYKKFMVIGSVCAVLIALFIYSATQKEKVVVKENETQEDTPSFDQGPIKGISALSRFGQPLQSTNFEQLPYVNPNAPKGGILKLGTVGSFDSLNKDTIKGVSAFGLEWMFDPLMARSSNEPFTLYGLIARSVEPACDNSSLVIHLNKQARFHDGSPITATDVAFTFKLLQKPGCLPRYRQYYSKIKSIDIIDSYTLKLTCLKGDDGKYDPELPLIVCLVRVLSKKNIENLQSFENSGMASIMGNGPYKISSFKQGRYITYERVKNYWAKNHPLQKGLNNFDQIQIDYFKTIQSHFLAFQAGEIDVYFETNPNQWEHGYDFKGVKTGEVIKFEQHHKRPTPIQTIIFNMQRPVFSDRRIRKALNLAFDFNSLNKLVFQGMMKCPHSLYENTYLAHHGKAIGEERKLLMTLCHDEELKKAMLDHEFTHAKTKGDGNQRDLLLKADELLNQAGYKIVQGVRCNAKGAPMTLDFIIKDPKFEKIALAFQRSLKMLGITLNVKMIDTVQYENRVIEREFDMIIHTWSNSLSPGNEQLYYFSVKNATTKGSSNYIGMQDLVAEELARLLVLSKTNEELTDRAHALDRYIMHQMYMIPLSCDPTLRFAYRKKNVAFPPLDPNVGLSIMIAWKQS